VAPVTAFGLLPGEDVDAFIGFVANGLVGIT
jgi:hypothetical protein